MLSAEFLQHRMFVTVSDISFLSCGELTSQSGALSFVQNAILRCTPIGAFVNFLPSLHPVGLIVVQLTGNQKSSIHCHLEQRR